MRHHLLLIMSVLSMAILCMAADEPPRASLLCFFSPESQVEFIGLKSQPRKIKSGNGFMQQISRPYSSRVEERGGEQVLDIRFRALADGKLNSLSVENQRWDNGKLQGYHPATLEELSLNGRNLLPGRRAIKGGARPFRVWSRGMKLESGKEYRIRACVSIASERERKYGAEVKSAAETDPSSTMVVVGIWGTEPETLEYIDSKPRFINRIANNGTEHGLYKLLVGSTRIYPSPEAKLTVRLRALKDCDIRTNFFVNCKLVDERGVRRSADVTSELTSLTLDGVELMKEPVAGNWYAWATPGTVRFTGGKIHTLVFTFRPRLPDAQAAVKAPRIAADFTRPAGSGKTLRPVFGINELRQPLITDTSAAGRARSDRTVGYNLRRLSNLDIVFSGLRVGDPFRIFGIFEADADDPRNYYFKATDEIMSVATRSDIPIIYSLAPTAEYSTTHYRTGEPDRAQFVKVCSNIIRHYNEKWADGFSYGIKRWEIWNEPDSTDYWADGVAAFGKFYAAVATELKKRFPGLEFGGPSFSEFNEKNFRIFLSACREAGAPLDFFSFKCYGPNPAAFARQIRAAKRLLTEYGYTDTKVIVSEYNYNPLDKTVWTRNNPEELEFLDKDPAGLSGSDAGAAAVLAAILWQDTPLESACIYGFSRHRRLCAYSTNDTFTAARGGMRAVLPLYSEFFNRAAPDRPVYTAAASEHLGVIGATDRRNGDGLLLVTALRDPGEELRLRLDGVEEGTRAQVRLWPAPGRRPGVDTTHKDYRWRDEIVCVRDGEMQLPKFGDSMVWLIRLPKKSLTGKSGAGAGGVTSPESNPEAAVDFSRSVGKFKRLQGINIAVPMEFEGDASRWADLGLIGFDTVRVHDLRGEDSVAGMAGDYQNIFPNYHADPADPANYNFAPTDTFMRMVRQASPRTDFVFRLGPTIENTGAKATKFWVLDPGNHDRFADICIGIIRHYDRNWANGFNYNIGYYEIWNEPNSKSMWDKSFEDYCRFYARVAKRIKAACPWIKIGGPAITRPDLQLTRQMADICREENAPLDFFSWHHYPEKLNDLIEPAGKIREILDERGFKNTELHLNEWRLLPYGFNEIRGDVLPRLQDATDTGRNGSNSAASVATALIRMQDVPIDMSNFYSYGNGVWGFYDKNGRRNLPWYAHRIYSDFIRACERRVATSDPGGDGLAVLGGVAADGNKYLLVSAYGEPRRCISIKVDGVPESGGVRVTRLDALRRLETFADCYENGVLKLEKDAGGTVFLVKFDE